MALIEDCQQVVAQKIDIYVEETGTRYQAPAIDEVAPTLQMRTRVTNNDSRAR
jgi:hypothetical protein